MNTILNIGLARNDGAPDNGVLRVVASLNEYGFKILGGEVHEVTHGKGVERTLIVPVKYKFNNLVSLAQSITALSNLLAQDFITVGRAIGDTLFGGDNYGPHAVPFDPSFFVLPKS